MRGKRGASLMLAGGTLVALTVLPTAAHAAAATLQITVGGDATVGGVSFEGMRFMAPSTISVHKGDTLNFNFAGFHTATLIPTGQSPDEWRAENTAGPGSAYGLIQPDSDDGAAHFVLNNAAVLPSDPTCGAATNPCTYNGNSVVNSGVPLSANSFAVTINANPGDVFWVLCLIHGGMQTRVQVVADNVATTTQSAINSYASSQTAADHEAAAALIPRLQHPTKHKTASGATVWDAFAGFDGNGWGLDGMFPHRLHVLRGDIVRWHFTQLMGNVHTVTFPKSKAVSLSKAFGTPTCEASPADTKPDLPGPPFCSSGPQNFELAIPGAAILPSGTHRYGGTGFRSAGVRGPDGLSVAPYDLRFTARSGTAGFSYACIIHGAMMNGTVYVK